MPQTTTSLGLGIGLPLLGDVNGGGADDALNLVLVNGSGDYVETDTGDFWVWS